ncbi:LacI family DNA-binding transcriptional regulator [Citreimonas sp.]|uniref:LacI family DNA-binding transcriptional regulator n=1 Tax=Citreimonas sp. TaxID=3036715 RepID=UPI004058F9FD
MCPSDDPSTAPPKSPTLADVAAMAGTSTITVSRALRHPGMVSEALRARITQAVEALGYVPNPAATALASRRTTVVGVVMPSLADPSFAEILDGLYEAAVGSAFTLQPAFTRGDAATEDRLIRGFAAQRPAALIVAGIDQSPASRMILRQAACPVVQIMDLADDAIDMLVGFSHRMAARAAVEHLLAQGYGAPAFIGAAMDLRAERRLAGYRDALEAAGLSQRSRVVTTPKPSGASLGATLFGRLREHAPDADSVLCNDDDLALGAFFAAQGAGLCVGRDIGICGFGDRDTMAAAIPAITSVRTPRREIGTTAWSMIAARLAGEDPGPAVRDLGFTIMARASTRLD